MFYPPGGAEVGADDRDVGDRGAGNPGRYAAGERLGPAAPDAAPTQGEMYRALARNLLDGAVVVLDRHLRIASALGPELGPLGLGAIGGMTLEEVLAADIAAAITPADRAALTETLRAALAGDERVTEVPWQGHTYLVHVVPVLRGDRSVAGAMVVARNVTQALLMEQALREGDDRYGQLFRRAGEAIYILSATGADKGTILDANPAAAYMHGFSLDELRGMRQEQLDAPGVLEGTPVDAASEWVGGESTHIRKDGTSFPTEFHAGPLDVGSKKCILVFLRDITDRRRHEAAILEAAEAEAAASRTKDALVAHMSHELRTPLNAILGYTQLLERSEKLVGGDRRHVLIIRESGTNLLRLITDVLHVSKVEAGTEHVALREMELYRLLDDTEHLFRQRAEEKRLAFEIHRTPDVPRYIVSDEGKLRQVLANLLGNAVKFTEEGGVTARVRLQGSSQAETPAVDPATATAADARPGSSGGAAGRRLIVEVTDTGPGIGAQELGTLFQRFVQARAGLQAQGGTGLGLFLSRQYARLLGGDLTVQSQLGVGSTFRLEIPIDLAAAPKKAVGAPEGRVLGIAGAMRNLRILVVDDEEHNRGWVRELLEQVGFEVHEAVNGALALEAVGVRRPHLVIIDVHMPEMDGVNAIRALRGRPGQRIPILALTASPYPGDPGRAVLDAGADAWLRKPVREGQLLEEVRKLLGIEYRYGPVPKSGRNLSSASMAVVDLCGLDKALVADLRAAAEEAGYSRLIDLLATAAKEHPAVAEALTEIVERFDYPALLALLPA